jgi:prolyl-tRNA synthetase
VLEKAHELEARLSGKFRVKLDDSDNSPGWKFAQYEMQGVPLRLEIGPRDIENDSCVIVRRTDRVKTPVPLGELEQRLPQMLAELQSDMFAKACARRAAMTYSCTELGDFIDTAANKPGFIKAMWCGSAECENKLKELAGVTSRNMPFEQEHLSDKCICCGKPAKYSVYWGKAY